ncbi:hypothetical protein [Candidatus Pelagisphaera phototrophica]|uniref:hypothetical protein n=1 Tax=Candidatus Pelagisphaera phototrophica TaxID=2684113 RepID=UPI0019FED042|nr:hypothetical protein [Candidatus Pelagisphaera phototrophica]QXD33704.1 hypothetical protein GA004_08475 [Candidatus Pelagisphaera phototrophica]
MLEAPELKVSIADAVQDYANKKLQERTKSLSRRKPEKMGLIPYLFCLGVSQSQMVKRHRICHKTIKHTLMEYADHLGKWTEVGARLSKQLFLNLHSLEEDMIEEVRDRMESGKLKATFRDVYYVSTAKEKSWQQAHRIDERREETRLTRKVVSQEEYENVLARGNERMGQITKSHADSSYH